MPYSDEEKARRAEAARKKRATPEGHAASLLAGKRHYQKHRERILAEAAEYNKTPEARARDRAYKEANREHLNAKERERKAQPHVREELLRKKKERRQRPEVKAQEKEAAKKWRAENAEKVREGKREWYRKNADEVARQLRERRANDPLFALKCIVRNRVKEMCYIKGLRKKYKFSEYIGCTADFLKSYLEAMFEPGMSWDRKSEIHIDHIYPLSLFDLDNEEEFKLVCHYSNLRPMWAKDNISKGNKVIVDGERITDKETILNLARENKERICGRT